MRHVMMCCGDAVIGYRAWQEQFQAADDVVGRTITLNGHPATIIGVAPRGFSGTTTGEYSGEYSGEYEGDTCRKNNNGYGNGAESGPPPGNSINNPQLLTWNSGKKGPR